MKTIVYIGTSLDGFIATKDGSIDWLTPYSSKEVFESYNQFIKDIDAIVIGRGTFDTVLTFPEWPYNLPLFVLSTSLKEIPSSLKEKVTLLSMKPKEVIEHLSAEGFSNVYVDGGKVIQSFLREDCIDEMIITKLPILIGEGIPLFGQLDKKLSFDLLKTETYPNDLVKSYYRRTKK